MDQSACQVLVPRQRQPSAAKEPITKNPVRTTGPIGVRQRNSTNCRAHYSAAAIASSAEMKPPDWCDQSRE